MLVNTLVDPVFRRWLATLDGLTEDTFLRSDGSVDLTVDWTIATKSITLTAGTLTAEQLTSTDDISAVDNITAGGDLTGTNAYLSSLLYIRDPGSGYSLKITS